MNWSYYIAVDDDADEELGECERSPILQHFMREHNCVIEYLTYESEDELNRYVGMFPNKLDVINIDHADALVMGKSGYLEVLDLERVPNKKHLDPFYVDSLTQENLQYIAPYLAGTMGILYRKDVIKGELNSWMHLFDPDKALWGKLNLMNAHETMFTCALAGLGKDLRLHTDLDLRLAAKLIYDLRVSGKLKHISSDIDEIVEKMTNGEICISPMYSGDAISAVDEDESGNLAFVIPEADGSNYLDCWTVVKGSQQKELALAFVNYMLDPPVHAENAAYLGGACPNVPALAYMREHDPEAAADKRVYPVRPKTSALSYSSFSKTDMSLNLWKKIIKGR